MRVGLCGLGEIGLHHLAAIRSSPDAELAAVCDLDQQLARRSAGKDVAVHASVAAMLAVESLDAVDVCLPHFLHREVALQALEAGCHVILEKPMAIDPSACDEIAAAAADRGLRVGVSHNQLFFGPHLRVAELIESGRLGALRGLYASLWIGGRYGGWRQSPDQVGGGLLMDAGVHRVYLLRALGGPVASVFAVMDKPRAEESFTVAFEFESGAAGVAQGSYHGPDGVFDDRLEVVGADGVAHVAGCEAFFEGDLRDGPQLRVRLDGGWRDEPVADSWDASVASSVHAILAAFAAGEQPRVDAAAGREAVALIDAAYRSAERGDRIELSGSVPAAG